MNERSIITVRCDYCGEPIGKGDDFVVFGKYPGVWKSLFKARLTGAGALPEDFGEICHPTCYLESLKEKQKEMKKEDAKP